MSKSVGLLVWPAALALGLVAESVAWAYSWDQPRLWVPDLAVGMTFIVCGGLVWERQQGTAALIAATGITWFTGTVFAALLFVHRGPLFHALVTYPGARPRSRVDGATVAVGYALALTGENAALTAAFSLAIATAAARRYVTAARPHRRQQRAALAGATVLAVLLVVGGAARLAIPGRTTDALYLLIYEIVLVGIALGLSVGLRRPATAAVADLVVELGETRSGLLRDRLARTLGDPTLEVGYWSAGAGGYVDEAGGLVALPNNDPGRSVTRIERRGVPFAVLVHDAAVLSDPALVEAVASAARLTAANVALQAERRARASELVASRRRLLVAADRERRSLEARLRRGPERRLIEVDGVLAQIPSNAGGEHVLRARRQLARTLVGLHELARGLHPRELADAGLPGALAALAERAPVPVELDVAVERLPDEIEATVYFVCAEALANIAKYAGAERAWLSLVVSDGWVVLRVGDDGIGGADRARGTGLQGLADRVDALGGRLRLDSRPGHGTQVSAEIPLG